MIEAASILEWLKGKEVTVQASGLKVQGRLLHHSENNQVGHVPSMLVLDADGVKVLLRDWALITVTGEKLE
jgi:hypothetical protein